MKLDFAPLWCYVFFSIYLYNICLAISLKRSGGRYLYKVGKNFPLAIPASSPLRVVTVHLIDKESKS